MPIGRFSTVPVWVVAAPLVVYFLVRVLIAGILTVPSPAVSAPEPSFAVAQAEVAAPIVVAVPLSLDVQMTTINSTMRAEAMAEWLTLTRMVVGQTEVQPSEHARIKHGPTEVESVRAAMRAQAAANEIWWNRPPCKDGRWRYVLGMADGSWYVWVLEAVEGMTGVLQEVTAFIAYGQDYAKSVDDHCGNGSWKGLVYGG